MAAAYQLDAPPRRRTDTSADALACGLGYFSLALGVTQLLAPHALARWLGRPQDATMIRVCGAREVVSGLGILCSERTAPWVWSRVGGDLLDLAGLMRGLDSRNPRRSAVWFAMGAVAGVTLLDVVCAKALTEAEDGHYVAPDYSDRSGFPKPVEEMRGAAASDRAPGPRSSEMGVGGLP